MAEAIPKLATSETPKVRTVTGWTILLLVLLRIAIGWHFFYEGIYKMFGEDDWRATSYLVQSQGPAREFFRQYMVKDVDGLQVLTVEGMQKRIDKRFDQLVKFYDITDEVMLKRISDFRGEKKGTAEKSASYADVVQKASAKMANAVFDDYAAWLPADTKLNADGVKAEIENMLAAKIEGFQKRGLPPIADDPDRVADIHVFVDGRDYQPKLGLHKAAMLAMIRDYTLGFVEDIFADEDFNENLDDYRLLLKQVGEFEAKLGTTGYNKERLADMYGRKAKAKAGVLARAERPLKEMEGFVLGQIQAAFAKAKAAGKADEAAGWDKRQAKALPPETSPTWFADKSNMYGLTIIGACLILGLFTRFAALCGAGMLAMFYAAMPALPWLPEGGPSEGHYLYVNKNLIEMIALLLIATTRIGRWGGLDAFFARKPKPPAA